MNLRKKLAIIAPAIGAAAFLSACGPSAQDANREAGEFCRGHGGVANIKYWPEAWPTFSAFETTCKDGSKFE